MKILFVSDTLHPVIEASAKGLARRGHEVILLSTVQEAAAAGETEHDGVRMIRWHVARARYFQSWRTINNPSVVKTFRLWLKEYAPDVVHFHTVHFFFSYAAVIAAKHIVPRTFFTFHSALAFWEGKLDHFIDSRGIQHIATFDYRVPRRRRLRHLIRSGNPFKYVLIRRALAGVTVLSVSNALKEALEQNGIKPVTVVYNGLDLPEYRSSSEEVRKWRAVHGLSDKRVVFAGGRISAQKGFGQLVEAFKLVAPCLPDVALCIVGNGPRVSMQYLREEMHVAGLADRLCIIPFLPHGEFIQAVAASDVVVVPSIYLDPLPTIVLEGMALQKPVIGSCFGGIPEMIVNGQSGRIINPITIGELASALITILNSTQLGLAYGRAGRERVERLFSLDAHLNVLEKEYTRASPPGSPNYFVRTGGTKRT